MLRLPIAAASTGTPARPLLPQPASALRAKRGGAAAVGLSSSRLGRWFRRHMRSTRATLLWPLLCFSVLVGLCWLLLAPRHSSADTPERLSGHITSVRPRAYASSAEEAQEERQVREWAEETVGVAPPLESERQQQEQEAAEAIYAASQFTPPPPPVVEESFSPPLSPRTFLSSWLSLRTVLDALSFDLNPFLPSQPPPAPIPLPQPAPPTPTRGGKGARAGNKGWKDVRALIGGGREKTYQPTIQAPPPKWSWRAELDEVAPLSLPVTFQAFFLLFPLPPPSILPKGGQSGYEGPWSLPSPSPSPTPFPYSSTLMSVHPSISSTTLDDLLRWRHTLRVANLTQVGRGEQQKEGADKGKIAAHIYAKGSYLKQRPASYDSPSSTPLFLLATVHFVHASNDLSFLEQMLPAIEDAYGYLVRQIDPASGLFMIAESEQAFSSSLFSRSAGKPTSSFLVQTQVLAALRAVRNLRKMLSTYAPSPPPADASATDTPPSSHMASLLQQVDAILARSVQPDLDGLIALVQGAIHVYYFARPGTQTTAHQPDVISPATTNFPPPPSPRAPSSFCPASTHPPLSSSSSTGITSDLLHGLFYLERSDLLAEEVDAWFQSGSSQLGEAGWDVRGCFQSLVTPIGFLSSSVHPQVRPLEQALIHAASTRFQLTHVRQAARSFFAAFQQALQVHRQRRVKEDIAANSLETTEPLSPSELYPEYFLLSTAASDASSTDGLELFGSTSAAHSWHSAGSPLHLSTAASWSYWIVQQAGQQHGESYTAASSLSRCGREAEVVLRGVPFELQHRYCPAASVSSSSSPPSPSSSPYPASVFTCLDGSALLWLSSVNDNYCDCADGSDEPGTAACALQQGEQAVQQGASLPSSFQCWQLERQRKGRKAPARLRPLPLSMLDDGVCDCCDGSDEKAENGGAICAHSCR